jgi:hypothetical protein
MLPTSKQAINFFAVTIITSILAFTVIEVWPTKGAVTLASTSAFMPTTDGPPSQQKEHAQTKMKSQAENR